jgi:4'-phosphopantetheinyl transferase EntD
VPADESPDLGLAAQALAHFLNEHLPTGCLGAVRPIHPDDDRCLTESEARGLDRAVTAVRRASGAGRDVARMLCRQLGVPVAEIPRTLERYPLWPSGIIGSIAHDREFAGAVVAPSDRLRGIGIDIEPAEPLQPGIGDIVSPPEEMAAFSDIRFGDKALFSIKEAVFKAVYPRDGRFLDFHEVTVARHARTARTNYGRVVHWRVTTLPRVLAIAWCSEEKDLSRADPAR